MKIVKLIRNVQIEEVMCADLTSLEVRVFPHTSTHCWGTNELLATQSAERYIVPIKHWILQKVGKNEWSLPEIVEESYIAVSPEIDSTLGNYFKIINIELQDKQRRLNSETQLNSSLNRDIKLLETMFERLQNLSFWGRLKFVVLRKF